MALDSKDPFAVQTKPHGHGDVHMLLHSSGLAGAWLAQGFKWVCFFQDTNGLVFRALPAALGAHADWRVRAGEGAHAAPCTAVRTCLPACLPAHPPSRPSARPCPQASAPCTITTSTRWRCLARPRKQSAPSRGSRTPTAGVGAQVHARKLPVRATPPSHPLRCCPSCCRVPPAPPHARSLCARSAAWPSP